MFFSGVSRRPPTCDKWAAEQFRFLDVGFYGPHALHSTKHVFVHRISCAIRPLCVDLWKYSRDAHIPGGKKKSAAKTGRGTLFGNIITAYQRTLKCWFMALAPYQGLKIANTTLWLHVYSNPSRRLAEVRWGQCKLRKKRGEKKKESWSGDVLWRVRL